MPPAEFIQLRHQVAGLHGCGIENLLGSSGPAASGYGQATVKRLADDAADRGPSLVRGRTDALVQFVVDENL